MDLYVSPNCKYKPAKGPKCHVNVNVHTMSVH